MKVRHVLEISAISFLAGFIMTASLAGSLHAEGYYIKKQTETIIDGKSGGGTSVLELWVKGDHIRYLNSNDKDNVLMINMDKDKVYQVNEKEKTVKEIDLKAQFAAVEKEMQVSSQKTEKKKTVDQWKAYQVMVTSSAQGMSTEVEYWMCDEIELPVETRMRMADYFGQRKILEELKKYPGYPVEIVVHLKAQDKKIDVTTKVIAIEKRQIDQHLFEIPADFTRTASPKPGAIPEPPAPPAEKTPAAEKAPTEKTSTEKAPTEKTSTEKVPAEKTPEALSQPSHEIPEKLPVPEPVPQVQ